MFLPRSLTLTPDGELCKTRRGIKGEEFFLAIHMAHKGLEVRYESCDGEELHLCQHEKSVLKMLKRTL